MATRTLRGNRKYVPRSMYAKKLTKKQDFGWIDYRMHEERKVRCMVWKDKQPVVLLSTHAEPIPQLGERPFIWHKIGGKKKKVWTGSMHLQYTKNMRDVDTADRLRTVYSSLTQSHKWWHCVFFLPIGHNCVQYVDYSQWSQLQISTRSSDVFGISITIG